MFDYQSLRAFRRAGVIIGAVQLDSGVRGAAGATAIASILLWIFGSIEGRFRCLLGNPGSFGVPWGGMGSFEVLWASFASFGVL